MKSLPKRALRPDIGSAGAGANMTIWKCRLVLGLVARLRAGRPNLRMALSARGAASVVLSQTFPSFKRASVLPSGESIPGEGTATGRLDPGGW